jgi:hypothetical protein
VDALSNVFEHFLDALAVLGRNDEVVGVVALGKLLYLVGVDHPHALEIGLVACDGEGDSSRGVFLEFPDPLFDLFEALGGGDLIDDDGSQGLAVVDGSNRVVLFLAGSVLHSVSDTQMASLTLLPFSSSIFFSR